MQQALSAYEPLKLEPAALEANLLYDLSSCNSGMGNYQRALELDQQALDMRRKLFGEQHPDIASLLNNLASDYSALGNPQRALELGQQALEMRRELLGATHPDTIYSLRFVAQRLFANPFTAGRGKALIEEHLRLVQRDHPARAELLVFLATQKGFRKPAKSGHGKKPRKRR